MKLMKLLGLAVVLAGGTAVAQTIQHGEPIEVPFAEQAAMQSFLRPTQSFVDGDISGFSVDTTDRTDVLSLYHCIYQASEDFASRMNWVGDIGACVEGTVSSDFHDDTLRRINYYRAMVGLNTDITLDPVKNAKCQLGALIMARNGGLSHFPIVSHPTWACLTADGDEAAGKSNISLSSGTFYSGPAVVDGQIRDNGSNNKPVGHRRWLLYPRAQEMGNGGISGGGGYGSSGVVWVIGDFGSRPATPSWVSWPNSGHVPYDLVPARWSFSKVGADFDTATVTMSQGGTSVPVTIVHPTVASPAGGYGDPAIVWEPSGLPSGAPATDTTYSVTVSGIVGSSPSSYTYDVVVMDPYTLTQDVVVAGSAAPVIDQTNTYTFTDIEASDSYVLRTRRFLDAAWTEGGESGDPMKYIDGTSASYSLVQSDVTRTGANAFHFAFPSFDIQYLDIEPMLRPDADGNVSFAYLRRYSSSANAFAVEISTDGGNGWTELWSVPGVCSGSCGEGNWDSSWTPVSLALAAYEGQAVQLRFAYRHQGNIFNGVSSSYGVFVDDIALDGVKELVDETETTLAGGTTQFDLVPDGPYTYLMDMRAEVGCYLFDFGPVSSVESMTALSMIQLSDVRKVGATAEVDFQVDGPHYTTYQLQVLTNHMTGWSTDTQAVYNPTHTRMSTDFPTNGFGTWWRVVGD